jgi:hypothetical protein
LSSARLFQFFHPVNITKLGLGDGYFKSQIDLLSFMGYQYQQTWIALKDGYSESILGLRPGKDAPFDIDIYPWDGRGSSEFWKAGGCGFSGLVDRCSLPEKQPRLAGSFKPARLTQEQTILLPDF